MSESERKAMCAAIAKALTDTRCGPLSPVEHAMVGVLATFMSEHIVLHRKVCELEKRVRR